MHTGTGRMHGHVKKIKLFGVNGGLMQLTNLKAFFCGNIKSVFQRNNKSWYGYSNYMGIPTQIYLL